jgi:tryptophan-rich sensory protein
MNGVAFVVTYALFSLSGLFFRLDRTWYDKLAKPSWTPSGAVIGLIWVTLYGCIAGATALVVHRLPVGAWPIGLAATWLFNWLANQSFTYWMFQRKMLGAAWLTALATCVSAAVLAVWFADISWVAGGLLVPYVVWTAIATVLAWKIFNANAIRNK